ncbi:MAG: 3-hydroxyacyl-CoA dehydrogenase [Acetobacteraceae bacterium]|nr:3-hydroxyacyl-CoA dehydrogenase [Acetobacteraceae bacterium]
MGSGITMTFANAGIPVLMKDVSEEALARGMSNIRREYEASAKKGRLSAPEMERRLSLIETTQSYAGFEDADIVVEAAFERMDVKKNVFSEMTRIANSGCILATNTSTLNIDEIATATDRPRMVIGTHFFSPAQVMKLLEVVRGRETNEDVIATAMALGKRLGKTAVLARNGFGFIGNRMVMPYVREAQFLVEEGASVEQVNQALFDFGMPMGPLAMEDLVGLDVAYLIRQEAKHFERPGTRRPILADLLYEKGRYGQKSGSGWSRYDETRTPRADPELPALIEEAAKQAGIERRAIADAEIVERCVYALINEGAKVLEEGIAMRGLDIDIVYVYGYGFPAWRGGPMFYADSVGLATVLQRVEEFSQEHGEALWQPAALLRKLAKEGGRLSE